MVTMAQRVAEAYAYLLENELYTQDELEQVTDYELLSMYDSEK